MGKNKAKEQSKFLLSVVKPAVKRYLTPRIAFFISRGLDVRGVMDQATLPVLRDSGLVAVVAEHGSGAVGTAVRKVAGKEYQDYVPESEISVRPLVNVNPVILSGNDRVLRSRYDDLGTPQSSEQSCQYQTSVPKFLDEAQVASIEKYRSTLPSHFDPSQNEQDKFLSDRAVSWMGMVGSDVFFERYDTVCGALREYASGEHNGMQSKVIRHSTLIEEPYAPDEASLKAVARHLGSHFGMTHSERTKFLSDQGTRNAFYARHGKKACEADNLIRLLDDVDRTGQTRRLVEIDQAHSGPTIIHSLLRLDGAKVTGNLNHDAYEHVIRVKMVNQLLAMFPRLRSVDRATLESKAKKGAAGGTYGAGPSRVGKALLGIVPRDEDDGPDEYEADPRLLEWLGIPADTPSKELPKKVGQPFHRALHLAAPYLARYHVLVKEIYRESNGRASFSIGDAKLELFSTRYNKEDTERVSFRTSLGVMHRHLFCVEEDKYGLGWAARIAHMLDAFIKRMVILDLAERGIPCRSFHDALQIPLWAIAFAKRRWNYWHNYAMQNNPLVQLGCAEVAKRDVVLLPDDAVQLCF